MNRKAAGECQETLCNQVVQETELSGKYFSWASPYSKEGSDQENFRKFILCFSQYSALYKKHDLVLFLHF